MKGGHVFLSDLSPNSKAYKVKVKVVDKGRPRTSPGKKLKYENLVLQDDNGNKMKGALFGDQVDGFKDALVQNGVYEITNAPIKKCPDEWQSGPDELDFQMSFGRQTVIQPLEVDASSLAPDYLCLAHIPRTGSAGEKFDVLGVVLYVEEKLRSVMVAKTKETLVREIVITDHSTEMPITISAWSDLAEDECDALTNSIAKFAVVGFTALKVTGHKGFSLSTTMSTTFVHQPGGDRAGALTEWSMHHQDALSNRQGRVLEVRNPSQEIVVTSIYALKLKKAINTMPEERRWLKVKVPVSDLDMVHVYIGCSKCNRRTEAPLGFTHTCTSCNKEDCVASIRVTFGCEIVDATGALPVTMFTGECGTLFGMSAAAISTMKASDDRQTFGQIQHKICNTDFLVQVGPTMALVRSKILQWVPRQVVFEDFAQDRVVDGVISAKATPNVQKKVGSGATDSAEGASKVVTTTTATNLMTKITDPKLKGSVLQFPEAKSSVEDPSSAGSSKLLGGQDPTNDVSTKD